MGVADRVRRNQASRKAQRAADSLTDGPGTSATLVVADPPHIRRLKGVVGALRTFIEANQDGSGMGRMAFVMTTFTDELAEELRDMDEIAIRAFLAQIGEVIAWVGHGDNSRVPEAVRDFAELVQPSPAPAGGEHDNRDAKPGALEPIDTQTG